MTKNESFKHRVRARIAKTGERDGAVRRSRVDSGRSGSGRVWHDEPEVSDATLHESTGRGWNEWCDLIDDLDGHDGDHTKVAGMLCTDHGLDNWWSQTVTVGWERITGRRAKYQALDGTFATSKTRTMTIDPDELRSMLLDADDRLDLFPGLVTVLRSRPTAKVPRLAIEGAGEIQITAVPKANAKTVVTVTHSKLGSASELQPWKQYWTEWLAALAGD